MLSPFLLVGVGGSGGITIRATKQALSYLLEQAGWTGGWPAAWQFLHVDSPVVQDGLWFPAPLLPSQEYLSLVPPGVSYSAVHGNVMKGLGAAQPDIERALPAPREVKVPIITGAGAYRAVGRTIALGGLKEIESRVSGKLDMMQVQTATAELDLLTRTLGGKVGKVGAPNVVVISSVAGGSGAGMFLDVAEAIKSAIGPKPQAHLLFSLLYAPDVFQQLGNTNMAAMVPNSMAAMVELVSGFWSTAPTEATAQMYSNKGLAIPQDDGMSTVGPAFNYVVGSKNDKISFGSQTEVYQAMGNSLSGWMTNATVQSKLVSYGMANFHAKSRPLRDETPLVGGFTSKPLSAMGFARVTLGTEKFFEYAAERLAKETTQTVLDKHIQTDAGLKQKTSAQWVQHYTDLNEGAFISDSGLDEVTEQNNQVIDAIHPALEEISARFRNQINSAVRQGMGKSGHDFNTWVTRITNSFETQSPALLDEISALRHALVRQWVEKMPAHILSLTKATIARQGLPVTISLLGRLIEQSRVAVEELKRESAGHISDASNLTHLVSQALGAAASMNAIPVTHPSIPVAVRQAENALSNLATSATKVEASELINDFMANFLSPLQSVLSGANAVLRERATSPKLLDSRANPYASWPDFKSKSVGREFFPAPNEQMLIKPDDFPEKFDELLIETVSNPNLPAGRAVVEEFISGSSAEAVQRMPKESQWDFLDQTELWIPRNRNYQLQQATGQEAAFDFQSDHMVFVGFAKKWLRVEGRAFRKFLDQTIGTYLNADGVKADQSAAGENFVQAFTAALDCCDPLIEIDDLILNAVHPGGLQQPDRDCTGIPLDNTSAIYPAVQKALADKGVKNIDSWFVGQGGGANRRSIEIFTQLDCSVNPMTMSSLMAPMSVEWNRQGQTTKSRESFMSARRARPLPEAIPAHPSQWRAMIRGWFVSQLLSQMKESAPSSAGKDRGATVSIWSGSAEQWLNFPQPLHTVEPVNQNDEYLPVVLNSLVLAMIECNKVSSLAPLQPYQRLVELGETWAQLDKWILDGELEEGAPNPLAESAGTPDMEMDERKKACESFFIAEQEYFRSELKELKQYGSSRVNPLWWEIRDDIDNELQACIERVESRRAQTGFGRKRNVPGLAD